MCIDPGETCEFQIDGGNEGAYSVRNFIQYTIPSLLTIGLYVYRSVFLTFIVTL